VIDVDEIDLTSVAGANAHAFRDASPFPHVVLDGLVPNSVLDDVIAEFPVIASPDAPTPTPPAGWDSFARANERKLALAEEQVMGPATVQLLRELNSQRWIDFLEALTGIDGLIPDPHYLGGGMHQIEPGGYLKIHADFSVHRRLGLHRRLNLLLYLNHEWDDSYGGHLELWDRAMTRCERRIAPVCNRMVVFATDSEAYHGHPSPLQCPPGRARRSLALYYYATRPSDASLGVHSTRFQRYPGEPGRLQHIAQRWLPPAVVDAWRSRARHR
jgi:hypothetical protein